MKKRISGILTMILLISVLASCSGTGETENPSGGAETNPETQAEPGSDIDKEEKVEISDVIIVDKKLFSVEVTLPSSMVENPETFSEENYVKENPGVSSAHFNDDGSFTTVMSRKKHREIVGDMKKGLDKTINDIVEDNATYPHIKEIEANKNYDKIKVKVNKEEYNEDFDVALYLLSMNIGIYQVYNGKDFYSEFEVYDISNDDLIKTTVFPDDLKD